MQEFWQTEFDHRIASHQCRIGQLGQGEFAGTKIKFKRPWEVPERRRFTGQKRREVFANVERFIDERRGLY